MVTLLIIADDFTGALDTGVQFQVKESLVLVYRGDVQSLTEALQKDTQVLIVDTDSRHLPPQKAYEIVYEVVAQAEKVGIPYIYKKTDSGMRGNIGSELTACLHASASDVIHYVPAFPQMGRTTSGGTHYIDGIPVSESVFGKDPFEPVRYSFVPEILAAQSKEPIYAVGKLPDHTYSRGILVYDSESEADIEQQVSWFQKNNQMHLLSGCAGLAAALRMILPLEFSAEKKADFAPCLLTVCGSINSITVAQLDMAEQAGAQRIVLTPQQKLDSQWLASEEAENSLKQWAQQIRSGTDTIIECGVHDMEGTSQYMRQNGISTGEARHLIAESMGSIMQRLLDEGISCTLLITGGDTLLALMEKLKKNTLVPIYEIVPGVVLSQLEYKNKTYNLISKSGGFGQKNLLIRLSEIIKQTNEKLNAASREEQK